jgi:hypothetical protein
MTREEQYKNLFLRKREVRCFESVEKRGNYSEISQYYWSENWIVQYWDPHSILGKRTCSGALLKKWQKPSHKHKHKHTHKFRLGKMRIELCWFWEITSVRNLLISKFATPAFCFNWAISFSNIVIYFFNCAISSRNFLIISFNSATLRCLFTVTLFLIVFARCPNFSVEIVSSRLSLLDVSNDFILTSSSFHLTLCEKVLIFIRTKCGEHVINRVVLQLPPKDSFKIKVSLLSR